MSSFEKLLSELSASSVPRVSLGEVCKESTTRNRSGQLTEIRSVTNKSGLVVTTDYFENSRTSADTSNYKVVEQGMFAYNPSRINVGSIAWHKEEHKIAVSPMYVVFEVDAEKVDSDYLMLFLESLDGKQQIIDKCEVGARFRLPFNSLSKISMPLPPLMLQREITSILAKFLQLEAALEEELAARTSQFNYFKDNIFASKQHLEYVPLEAICTKITSGGTPPTSNREFYVGSIPWVRTSEVDFRAISDTEIHISEAALKQSSAKWIPSKSVVMAMIGATIGKVAYTEIDVTTNQNCCNLIIDEAKADYRYVFFWLWSQYEVIKSTAPGAVPIINSSAIKRLQIPLPPLDEQKRISKSLACLQELIQNPVHGIPAELQARRIQYEYFRNKLLTFDELKADSVG